MTDYIDRDMLIAEGWHMERLIRSVAAGMATITIETKEPTDFPAADVKPVLRARWEICSDGYYPYCSNCKEEPQGRVMTDFCPNCGADMREK